MGKSVAIDKSTAVVGAYALSNGSSDGRVYVYQQQGMGWAEVAQLVQSDALAGTDEFGNSVGVSGNVIVAGAEFNDNALGQNAGAAYVFEQNAGAWTEVIKLLPSDGAGEKHFGEFVAVSGNTIVVGHRENGTQGNNAGAAYVFEKVSGLWVETAKLMASDGAKNALYGDSVAVDGATIVVGAYKADAGGVKGPGAAYVYQKVAGSWVETQKLQASDLAGGGFARSVDMDGGTIVIGAWKDSSIAFEAGSAYVFESQGGAWMETAKLLPSAALSSDWIGHSVGVSGNSIVVSAHRADVAGPEAGGAYLFQDTSLGWTEIALLQSNDMASLDEFGHWVAIDGENIVLGAPFKYGNRGAAYVFDTDCSITNGTIVRYGTSAGGANVADLGSYDHANPGLKVDFDVSLVPAASSGLIWFSPSQTSTPFRSGTLLADLNTAYLISPIQSGSGSTKSSVVIPLSAAGLTVYAQAAVLDASQPGGIAFTNGLIVAIGG